MKHRPHEALVQVWMVVALERGHDAYTDQEIRKLALAQHGHLDAMVMDEDAPVYRDTETWCEEEEDEAQQ
jgi:hypothetical protein